MTYNGVTIKRIDEIEVGDSAYFAKTVSEADVMMFAQLSGDYAPHHVNKEFGETTMFHSRIAHGMLTAGLICPVLTKLCGDASYIVSQDIKFKTAVVLNDTITVTGKITDFDIEKKVATIEVICTKQGWKEGDRPVILATFIQSLDMETEL